MLAYAANAPQVAVRRPSPKTFLLIVAAHAVAVGLLITAKTQMQQQIVHKPTTITLIPKQTPPPPNPAKPRVTQLPRETQLPQPPTVPPPQQPTVALTPTQPEIGNLVGAGAQPPLGAEPQPTVATPAPTPAWLLTPTSELKPPYPESKLLTGEEATLRLRLSIDDHGRVVAVDPAGPADRTFLDAARRYLMAHWRYSPATQAGKPVPTSLVITLKFQLDG
jgi:periplasmic protein TonB